MKHVAGQWTLQKTPGTFRLSPSRISLRILRASSPAAAATTSVGYASPAKYAQDIARLAQVSQINAGILLKLGGVSVLSRTVIADWSEQTRVNMQSDPIGHAEALRYAERALGGLIISELGMDEKIRPDGTTKRRIIHDLKKSKVNVN